jgi:uroporphyrinogen-III synthase
MGSRHLLRQSSALFAMLGSADGIRLFRKIGEGKLTAATDTREDSTPLPLAGRRILVTRAPHQASLLADGLRRLGATPILIPTIEIAPPSSFTSLDAAIASAADYDLVAFTSANAVHAFAERAALVGRTPTARRVAVVGPATARVVEAIGLHVDVLPPAFTAESLGEILLPEAAGRSILLVLAEGAPPTLERALTAAGAHVKIAAAYSNRIPQASLGEVAALFSDLARMPHAVTFTSASTANNLAALLKAAGVTLPDTVTRISIWPVTSQAMQELALPAHAEATESTIEALIEAVRSYRYSDA